MLLMFATFHSYGLCIKQHTSFFPHCAEITVVLICRMKSLQMHELMCTARKESLHDSFLLIFIDLPRRIELVTNHVYPTHYRNRPKM